MKTEIKIKKITTWELKELEDDIGYVEYYGISYGTRDIHIIDVVDENGESNYELGSLMNALADVNRERAKLIEEIMKRLPQ
jgi:hypothetical protein